jgi:hypothetical protein
MHLFDVNGVRQKDPVPDHYSVLSSEYDPGNDRMTVFAALDADRNGRREDAEPVHIHWIDLKDPPCRAGSIDVGCDLPEAKGTQVTTAPP